MELLIGIVGSIIAAILCAIVVGIYRRTKKWKSRSAALATSVAAETWAMFEGRVQVVTDELLTHPASSRRVQQFYAGAKLDWDIIVANGDIPRDQREDLLSQVIQSSSGIRLICVVAEAGAGKSTLAWRVAAELCKKRTILILHIKDPDDADVWYRLPELYAKLGCPFLVLVDDIFHDPEAASAFRELNPWLPLTILATSRRNEYHRGSRLKCEALRFDLKPPSEDEKERILKRLDKGRASLTRDQQQRLNTADQFIVLMMELTEGKELGEIVRDSIERLRQLDEPVHRAYEYLCFAYRQGIEVPVSLVEKLDSQGRFHNLPDRETAQGLIFWGSRKSHVRVGHAVIAETAAAFYGQQRSPEIVLAEITSSANSVDRLERQFLARIFREMAKSDLLVVTSVLESLGTKLDYCVRDAEGISELTYWRTFYRLCGDYKRAEACVDRALNLEPVSSLDCTLLHSLWRERGREESALPAIEKWIKDHPEGSEARVSYLGLVERYGTANEIGMMMTETGKWLRGHVEDNLVRTRFLALVERQGTAQLVDEVIKETSSWLKRTADFTVWRAYLALVGQRGASNHTAQVIRETSTWLSANPDTAHVRTAWIAFVEARGTVEVKEATIADSKEWLAEHPLAKEVWSAFLSWMFHAGRIEEAANLALTAVSRHPSDQNLLEHYVRLIQQQGSADQQIVRSVSEQLIAKYPKHLTAQVQYAAWLRQHGYYVEAEERYKKLINAKERKIRMMANYGYGRLLLTLERFNESSVKFREVLKIRKGHQMAHDGLALGLWKLGEFGEAEKEFRSAIYFAGTHGQSQARFYNDLGWFYNDRRRWRDALRSFELARDEDPEYFGNYWGIGKALMGDGGYKTAAEALHTALEKEPKLGPPASDEINDLLRQCLERLNIS